MLQFVAYLVVLSKNNTKNKLIENERKLQGIVDNLPDLIFYLNKEGRFLDYKKGRFSGKLEFEENVFLNKTIFDIYPPDFADKIQSAIIEALFLKKSELFYSLEINKTRFYHSKFAKLSDSEVIAVVRDITKQKEHEELLEKYSNQMKEVNANKDRFMSIIAHDLRSPFNTIIGFSGLILKRFETMPPEKIKEQVKMINTTGNATLKLLDDLLMWSKSQSGLLNFQPIAINLSLVCNRILLQLEMQAEKKEIGLLCNVDEKIELYADVHMLDNILRNLISNAIKFTSPGGTVSVSVIEMEDFAAVTVSDTGMGISPEDIPKLWNTYEKYSTCGTDGEKGTGLGLLLCKEFVAKHHGELQVKSEINKGSDFTFTIPMRETIFNEQKSNITPNQKAAKLF